MAATAGKLFVIKVGTDSLLTAKSTSMTINGQRIEITNKKDGAWKRYLSGSGTQSISVSVDGVYEDDEAEKSLQEYALSGISHAMTIQNGLGDTWAGNFIVQNYGTSGSFDGALSYSCTLENDGAITFTPHV